MLITGGCASKEEEGAGRWKGKSNVRQTVQYDVRDESELPEMEYCAFRGWKEDSNARK